MSRRDFVLPQEALDLVKLVADLETRAERVRKELAADLAGIRQAAELEVEEARRQTADERREAAQRRDEIRRSGEAERAKVEQATADLAHDREVLEALLQERVRGFGLIGDAWADYEQTKAEAVAVALETKDRPAPFAAEGVRSFGRHSAQLRRELKRAEWVLRLYEWNFPWLTELRDLEEEQSFIADGDGAVDATDDGQPRDPAQHLALGGGVQGLTRGRA